MRYLYIFIILLIIPTIVVTIVQPTMHKQFVLTGTNIVISQAPATVTKNETKSVNTKNTEEKITKESNNTASVNKQTVKQNTVANDTKKEETKHQKEIKSGIFSNYPVTEDSTYKKNKAINNTNYNQITNTQEQKKNAASPVKNIEKVKNTSTNKQTTTTKSISNKTNNESQKTEKIVPKKQEVKKPTPQEEIIAWNEWNANVRNVILSNLAQKRNNKEIKLVSGCNYSYSFMVTSGGKISNISVNASVDNADTQKVKDSIKSIISSMAYSNVLKFPRGSQKQTYNVSSNISISSNVKKDSKAKATDFSKYEKVVK